VTYAGNGGEIDLALITKPPTTCFLGEQRGGETHTAGGAGIKTS
jgi:hypothetical protein